MRIEKVLSYGIKVSLRRGVITGINYEKCQDPGLLESISFKAN
jgi:hypothetical protein